MVRQDCAAGLSPVRFPEAQLKNDNDSKLGFDEDVKLMLRAATHDRLAFGKLYNKYYAAVVNFLASRGGCRTSATDLAEEVFKRVWSRREQYQPDSTVKTYLFGVARNVLREEIAAIHREKTIDFSAFSSLASRSASPAQAAQNADLAQIAIASMAKLPKRQRQTLELVYIRGLSVAETATILNSSANSVRKNLDRALKRLRKSVCDPRDRP